MWARIKRLFGLRCLVLMCPGEIVTTEMGNTFWRCTYCGAQTRK